MRPPVHMPLPAMTIAPCGMRLIAMDSSAVRHSVRFGRAGSARSRACHSRASSSNSSACFQYTPVASMAIGLSRNTRQSASCHSSKCVASS